MDINISKLIGAGYKDFWEFKGRYRVVKGGRGSKKSTTTAFYYPYNMMKYYHLYGVKPNVLVMRRCFNTHRDSTFAQLRWAIDKLGVNDLWVATKSPLELRYLPSGQRILFRGLDEPQSITSITVRDGHLCWVWWEEAFQVTKEDDFNKVDMSIRGVLPPQLFKQHTLTMNPWSEKIWIKSRFFDVKDPGNVLALTKNYDCNEFLGEDDLKIYEEMRLKNPRRYNIEGLGNWGIAEGLIFTNIKESNFDYLQVMNSKDRYGKLICKKLFGLDFGYTNDPTAFIALLADEKNKKIYVYDEIYGYHLRNKEIYEHIKNKGYHNEFIAADSAEPKSIDELKILGLNHIYGAKKLPGSVMAGIQKLQDYEILVHPSCNNFLVESNNYCFKKDNKTGDFINEPMDEYNHLMDALRYATIDLSKNNFSW